MPRVARAIWGRDRIERARRRWALVRPPLPAVPHEDAPRTGRAAGEAAATRWCDTANAPGRGPIRGRDRIGRAPALRPLPHPGPYLECPRRTRLRPALGLAGRLRPGCAASTMPRSGAPSGAEIVLGRAPTVGRPHHPGHTPGAPEGSASDEDRAGRQGRDRRIWCSDGICMGGERDFSGRVSAHTLDARVVRSPVGGTDACRCG